MRDKGNISHTVLCCCDCVKRRLASSFMWFISIGFSLMPCCHGNTPDNNKMLNNSSYGNGKVLFYLIHFFILFLGDWSAAGPL